MNIVLLIIILLLGIALVLKLFSGNEEARQCAYGNPEVYQVLAKAKGYKGLKQLMGKAQSNDERYFISVSMSRMFPMEALEKWLQHEPESADALLCYGARLLQWAWSARGYGRGHEVSEQQWKEFYIRLDKTRETLLRCAELKPDDPSPWAYLIMVATWFSDDRDSRWYCFEQARQRDKTCWAAHIHMIIALSEKWGGSNREMIRFAEGVAEQAEEGSDLPIILLKAYLENWKYLYLFDDDFEQAQQFIQSPEVLSRALAAYQKSLGSSSHKEMSSSIFAHYNASAWFWMVKDREMLARELDYLGNKIEDIHWRWAASEGELEDARAFASGKA